MSRTANSRLLILLAFCFIVSALAAQKIELQRIEPPHWYSHLHADDFQLMLQGKGVGKAKISCENSAIVISDVIRYSDSDLLVVSISGFDKAGSVTFNLSAEGDDISFEYQFLERKKQTIEYLNPSDFIYLIMPDRFANGDEKNDVVKGMQVEHIDRTEMYQRHGGDIQGIIDNLDYIEDLGATTLWLNPILTNDQPKESYHGYAQTNLYEVDPRFGTNQTYLDLVNSCHERKMKVIKDMVYNHWGDRHWLFQLNPDSSWFNWWDSWQRTSYRATTLLDPHASKRDLEIMSKGWFDHHMPDLNQKDPIVANYLIQNSLWWIEYAQLSGIRIDTYAYSDQEFMADLGTTIEKEFPGFPLFGETWVHGSFVQSWFTSGADHNKEFNSHLPGVTDFQSYYAINEALTKESGWTQGSSRLYYTLAADGLYESPERNVVFLDNHDLSRFMSMCGENTAKFKCGLAWLLTVRGIPMLYYGTEIGMKNFSDPDGLVREDFPGGWKEDSLNLFEKANREGLSEELWNYVSHLANWRKDNSWLGSSKLTQFVPKQAEYVFARHDGDHAVLFIMNPTDKEVPFSPERYIEITGADFLGEDVITGRTIDLGTLKSIEPNSVKIIQLH